MYTVYLRPIVHHYYPLLPSDDVANLCTHNYTMYVCVLFFPSWAQKFGKRIHFDDDFHVFHETMFTLPSEDVE